ncbi:MAG: ClpP family protease [Candidatus Thorarchaeota archaeon]|jgi:ATP-dependent Clp protease protease subunit
MARQNDFYSNYFDYGIDPRRKRLFLYEDIDEISIGRFIQGLVILADENTDKPIEILMSSCGGCEYEMLAAYDMMRSLVDVRIVVKAIGKIMSAAPLILAAGDERLAYPNTQFMVHESWYGMEERHNNARVTVAHFEAVTKLWAERMAERTNLTAKQWLALTEKTGRDKYFDAEQALKYGLIDKIIEVD